ncbi:MAG: HEPN domain-containing protein [Deltaproteobacteria bacterium]|nr:HEPN domain-containing protein [Deltaproteobacteria bacterium]
MKDIHKMREKAQRSLKVAKELHQSGDYDFSVSRSYYAMFYVAEALLKMKGESCSKHAATLAAFYKHYVRSGLLSRKYHQMLNDAYELRNDADYLIPDAISKKDSEKTLSDCEEFLKVTERFFKAG